LAEFGRLAASFPQERITALKSVTDTLTQNLRRLCQANEDLAMIHAPLADLLPIFRA
jgi:hypothetical protein